MRRPKTSRQDLTRFCIGMGSVEKRKNARWSASDIGSLLRLPVTPRMLQPDEDCGKVHWYLLHRFCWKYEVSSLRRAYSVNLTKVHSSPRQFPPVQARSRWLVFNRPREWGLSGYGVGKGGAMRKYISLAA